LLLLNNMQKFVKPFYLLEILTKFMFINFIFEHFKKLFIKKILIFYGLKAFEILITKIILLIFMKIFTTTKFLLIVSLLLSISSIFYF